MNEKPLAGRVALVTGVSRRRGIGLAIARRLGELGAGLFLHSYAPYDAGRPWGADTASPIALATDLAQAGCRVAHQSLDLADPAAPGRLLAAARAAFDHIDILVLNHAHSIAADLEALTAAAIDEHLAVNVRASLLLIQAFARQHDDRPGGRVILLTSGQHRLPMPGELPYIAAKGALHQLTLSLSAHLAPRAITVNTVDPGATDTGYADPVAFQAVLAREPMGRWGQPEDAARLIGWLATDEAAWITGQVISSTGGGP